MHVTYIEGSTIINSYSYVVAVRCVERQEELIHRRRYASITERSDYLNILERYRTLNVERQSGSYDDDIDYTYKCVIDDRCSGCRG